MKTEIRNAGFERQAGAGVIITGGAAGLRGFTELAEDILDLPVRTGLPLVFSEEQRLRMPQIGLPEFATVCGLVVYGEKRRKMQDFHENANTGFKRLLSKVRAFI